MKTLESVKYCLLCAAIVFAAHCGFAYMLTGMETVDGIKWTYTVSGGKASVGGGWYGLSAVPASTSGAITIPSSLGGYPVTGIGDEAFYHCVGLTSVAMPNSVTEIGHEAFHGCSGLTNVTISGSVTSIGDCAFYACSGLKSVVIPEGVTSVGEWAFYNCCGLTSVTIPNSVMSIGNEAFSCCCSLRSFFVGEGNRRYKSTNGLLLARDGEILVAGVNGDVVIPDSVTIIGDRAFHNCTGLTSVTIPDSVTTIGYRAFYGCKGLSSVTIPGSVMSIWCMAFHSCSGLMSVTINGDVPGVGCFAFDGVGKGCIVNITKWSMTYEVVNGKFQLTPIQDSQDNQDEKSCKSCDCRQEH